MLIQATNRACCAEHRVPDFRWETGEDVDVSLVLPSRKLLNVLDRLLQLFAPVNRDNGGKRSDELIGHEPAGTPLVSHAGSALSQPTLADAFSDEDQQSSSGSDGTSDRTGPGG